MNAVNATVQLAQLPEFPGLSECMRLKPLLGLGALLALVVCVALLARVVLFFLKYVNVDLWISNQRLLIYALVFVEVSLFVLQQVTSALLSPLPFPFGCI